MFHMFEEIHDGSLISLVDSLSRLQGRLLSVFAPARPAGLSPTEMTVLNAVGGATSPPTVPQIGRSLGHARQVIQRAANTLIAAGLIDMRPNPDHKRASLLVSTRRGMEVKAQADAQGAAIARALEAVIDPAIARQAVLLLDELRAQLDEHARSAAAAAASLATSKPSWNQDERNTA